MALPLKVKTWQFSVNQSVYDTDINVLVKKLFIAVKNSMTGFASSPWVVWGSSAVGGGNFGNNDGVDRWASTPSNIVHGSSWMVLENTVTGMQVLFDFTSATYAYQGSLIVSCAGGFGAVGSGGTGADGTLDTPPTAADQIVLISNNTWAWNAVGTYKLHVMQSADGECTRVVTYYNNAAVQTFIFDKPASPITGWTAGVAGAQVAGTDRNTYAVWNDAAALRTMIGSDAVSLYMTCEGCISSMVGEQIVYQDDDTGEWPIMPIGLLAATGTHRGRKGAIYDMWWGSTAAGTGNTYPADASNQFVQFGHFIFPWNGTTPETA